MQYTPQRNKEIVYQFDLYAEIKHLLRDSAQYQIEPEYRQENCRFDIIIAKNSKVKLIIETKKLSDGSFPDYKTPQIEKYKKFGIPVVICGHHKDIRKVAKAVCLFVTSDAPWEKHHNGGVYNRLLAQLKFMSTTKKKKNVKALRRKGEGSTI